MSPNTETKNTEEWITNKALKSICHMIVTIWIATINIGLIYSMEIAPDFFPKDFWFNFTYGDLFLYIASSFLASVPFSMIVSIIDGAISKKDAFINIKLFLVIALFFGIFFCLGSREIITYQDIVIFYKSFSEDPSHNVAITILVFILDGMWALVKI